MIKHTLCAGSFSFMAIISAVQAASDVSPKFDGIYSGTAAPAPGMGASPCANFAVEEVTIARGILRSTSDVTQPRVGGFITEEGYLAAHMSRPGHERYAMDGRIDGDAIVAGFIDPEGNCYWVVHLNRRP